MFSIKKEDFVLSLLTVADIVVSKTSTTPIFMNVLLRAISNKLSCIASNGVMSVRANNECECKTRSVVCLPAKELLDRIKKYPADSLVTVHEDGRIECDKSKTKHRLPVIDYADFPIVKFEEINDESILIRSSVLSELLDKTWFAVADDASRPSISNAYLSFDGRSVKIKTFDGYRLTYAEKELKNNHSKTLFIPYKSVMFIRRNLAKLNCAMYITVSETKVTYISAGDTTYSFRSMNVDEPEFDKIFAIRHKNSASFKRTELVDTLMSAMLTDDKVDFVFNSLLKQCKVNTSNNTGSYSEGLLGCVIKGIPTAFRANARFILDAINAASSSKDVLFELGDNSSDPIILSDNWYVTAIAPMV